MFLDQIRFQPWDYGDCEPVYCLHYIEEKAQINSAKNSRRFNIKTQIAHDAILLSRIISEKQTIKISFPDGEYLTDQLKWHTESQLGLKTGKVVNKNAIQYWEVMSE